jgi:tetratricopeptide (TPR) repeat protein
VVGVRRNALIQFIRELEDLRQQSGSPSLNQLSALTRRGSRPLPRSTISDKLNAKSLPDWDFVVSFVNACREYSASGNRNPGAEVFDLARWDSAHLRMLRCIDEEYADIRLVAAARAEVARRRDTAAPPPRRPGPDIVARQLPTAVGHLAGRIAEMRALDRLVQGQDHHTMIALVTGTAGVGKSALAVSWAHRMAGHFPDGQLYVNLRGFDPGGAPMNTADAIRGFLDAFAVPGHRIPVSLDAQAALYRSLLAGRRILVVLDNARDAEQVRTLLPGGSPALVLVTSRNQLTSLITAEGALPLALDMLDRSESSDLLRRRLPPGRADAEPDAVDEIISRCAGLPLALAIVATRGATHPHLPLALLAAELRHSRQRLNALVDQDPGADLRTVLSASYHALTPAAAGLFRQLGLHPGPDVSVAATASLSGRPVERVRPLLAELTGANLLVEHAPGRYTFHDLLRDYAAELAEAVDTDTGRRKATHRMLDHYLHSAVGADRLLNPYRDEIRMGEPRDDVVPEDPPDHERAMDWFTAELPALRAVVDRAYAGGWHEHTWQLAWAMFQFLNWRGQWHTIAAVQHTAVAASRALDDPVAEALALRLLALALVQLGQADMAHRHLTTALNLYQKAGDAYREASTHLNLSWLCERQARLTDALNHGQRALDLFESSGDRLGHAQARNTVGWYHALLGEYHDALTHCQAALPVLEKVGDHRSLADTWDSLGYAHHHNGDHAQATTCYRNALRLFRDLGDRYHEATILTHMADALQASGDADSARRAYQEALTILNDLDHPDADYIRNRSSDMRSSDP